MPVFSRIHEEIADYLYSSGKVASVEDVAAMLGCPLSSAAEALEFLAKMGLVSKKRERYYMDRENREQWEKFKTQLMWAKKIKQFFDDAEKIIEKSFREDQIRH